MMKKIILTVLLGFVTIFLQAQEKGFYLTASGSLGGNYFNYKPDGDNSSSPKLGWGAGLGVQYFFTQHWGVATGLGLTYYHTQGMFTTSWENDPAHYRFADMQDNSGKAGEDNYTMLIRLDHWKEIQQAYLLEVPLMLMYQTKWGKAEKVGMYAGLGAKVQIPVLDATYQVDDNSNLQVLAYYDNTTMQMLVGSPYAIPEQGLGSTKETGYEGDLSLKTGIAGTAELGFLFSLSPRVDLSVGGYFDYGFTNIQKNETQGVNLVEPTSKLTPPKEEMYVGKNIAYNGYMNSYAVDKANTIAYGAKVGVRVKLGKLKERPAATEEEPDSYPKHTITETHTSSRDTIVVIYTPKEDTNRYDPQRFQPVSERVQPTDDELRILFEPIFFDLDQDVLLPESKVILNRKAAIMERYPKMQLLITGNTCDLGSGSHNIDLGQRRAHAAMQYLETLGVSKGRLSTVSQSFSHPMMPNTNEENRGKNRRCDFYPTGY